MALARCILGKFLGVVCHCFPLIYIIKGYVYCVHCVCVTNASFRPYLYLKMDDYLVASVTNEVPLSNNTGHKYREFITIVLILFPSRFQ
jgi:hypothetical protein